MRGLLLGTILCLFSCSIALSAPDPVSHDVVVSGRVPDTRASFEGYTTPGGFVTIREGGSILGTVSANASGYFTKTLYNQTAGNHTYSLTMTDPLGTETSADVFNLNLLVMRETKATNIILPATIYKDMASGVRLHGYAYPYSTINIFINPGGITESVVTNRFGIWTHYVRAHLSAGSYTAYVRVSHPSGFQSVNSKTVSFYYNPQSIPSQQSDAPVIHSNTHPDQNKWYKANSPLLYWEKGSATGFSYVWDHYSGTVPSASVNLNNKSIEFANQANGIWYLHVRQLLPSGWSSTGHYRVQIDNQPPEELIITTYPEGTSEKRPIVVFSAIDTISGIDHYELSLDKQDFFRAESPYLPEKISAGVHVYTVRAYDRAGNMAESEVRVTIPEVGEVKITFPETGDHFGVFNSIKVTGTAPINTVVDLYLDGENISRGIKVDDKGNWEYVYEKFIGPGKHNFVAIALRDNIESKPSNTVDVQIDLVKGIPNWIIYLLLIILILIPLIWLLIILWKRRRKKKDEERQYVPPVFPATTEQNINQMQESYHDKSQNRPMD